MTEKQWMKEFTTRVKKRMRELDITQAELSKLTGIPHNSISVYLSGRIMPRAIVIPKLAKGLILNVSDLIDF